MSFLETMPENEDLLQNMEQDPLLRHEIFAYFYRYMEKKEIRIVEEVTGDE